MKKSPPFTDAAVEAVFDAYPEGIRDDLLSLRALILETAEKTEDVGPLIETLKWGQPSYLPEKPKTGSTVRIDALAKEPGEYAMFFHCQTSLVDGFRELYPDEFMFQGNRALVFSQGKSMPREALMHCVACALTYHINKK